MRLCLETCDLWCTKGISAGTHSTDNIHEQFQYEIISKFADGMNISDIVNSVKESSRSQEDMDELLRGTECRVRNQMEFNSSKCTVMHFGRTNKVGTYTISGGPRTIEDGGISR